MLLGISKRKFFYDFNRQLNPARNDFYEFFRLKYEWYIHCKHFLYGLILSEYSFSGPDHGYADMNISVDIFMNLTDMNISGYIYLSKLRPYPASAKPFRVFLLTTVTT